MAESRLNPPTVTVALTAAQAELLGQLVRFGLATLDSRDVVTAKQLAAFGLVDYEKVLNSQSWRSMALWRPTTNGEQAWQAYQQSAERT